MTVLEFSDTFDVLLNSYSKQASFGELNSILDIVLDEYEKSIFLTKAQEDVVLELYTGNQLGLPFEKTEEIRRKLNYLVKLEILEPMEEGATIKDKLLHKIFELPKNCWYIIYELGIWADTEDKCLAGTSSDIVPVTHDEYFRTIRNPFRGPNTNRILRLDSGKYNIELVSTNNVAGYLIRYIERPEPIILTDLGDLKINELSEPKTCLLPDVVHYMILDRAVSLALAHKNINKTQER